MKQLETYTYTIPAGGSIQIPAPNDNFYVNASTGPLSVRGDTFGRLRGLVAGQGLKGVPFNRLELIDESGAPNTVTILLTPAEFVNQVFSGSVAIVGALALNAATLASMKQPMQYGTSFDSVANLAAGGTEQVFAAASNVNGAIIHAAGWSGLNAGAVVTQSALIAHTAAPAGYTSGDVLMVCKGSNTAGGGIVYQAELQNPIIVPAGKGLWFYSINAETSAARYVLYTLL